MYSELVPHTATTYDLIVYEAFTKLSYLLVISAKDRANVLTADMVVTVAMAAMVDMVAMVGTVDSVDTESVVDMVVMLGTDILDIMDTALMVYMADLADITFKQVIQCQMVHQGPLLPSKTADVL